MSYSSTNWPPLQIPLPTSSTGLGSTVSAAPAPPSQIVQPAPQNLNWTASAPPVNNLTPLSPVTTQQQINSFFGIVNFQVNGQAP